jgi:hypothetical protein
MATLKRYNSFTALKKSKNQVTVSAAGDYDKSYTELSKFFMALKKSRKAAPKANNSKVRV